MPSRLSTIRAISRRWLALYVPAAAGLLCVSAFVGFLLGSAVPIESLPMAEQTGSGSGSIFPPLTTSAIAINNLVAMGFLLLGAVSVGLLTIVGLLLNGVLIGAVIGIAVQQFDPAVVAALIVPHGILEIPALLIVSAIGLRFGRLTVRYIRGLEAELVTVQDLREVGWLVAVSALLILVAAYIEATLTIEVAEQVAGGELTGVAG